MDRHRSTTLPESRLASLGDAQGPRALIMSALATDPVDDASLRRAVWTYVSAARYAGTAPGRTIMALTLLVETAGVAPASARQALTRQVIHWCVEAHLGVGGQQLTTPEEGWPVGISTPA